MGKTTNILDLNNRLEKVEKENVAQNNYNSLKNRPKINGNLLTGDKTGAQLGLAEAQEVGNLNALTTTDKSSAVAAINEVNSYFVNLEPISEANINAFFKNVCTGFLALNPILRKPHNIFTEWSQHNNYFGQIVDINGGVVVATLTSAGGSQMISGYYKVASDEVVVNQYSPST